MLQRYHSWMKHWSEHPFHRKIFYRCYSLLKWMRSFGVWSFCTSEENSDPVGGADLLSHPVPFINSSIRPTSTRYLTDLRFVAMVVKWFWSWHDTAHILSPTIFMPLGNWKSSSLWKTAYKCGFDIKCSTNNS